MLRILLKKQLTEIFRSYFYDAKKNRKRSNASVIAYFVLFALLVIGLVGGIFTYLSFSLCGALCEVGLSWLYFAVMGLIAAALGTFGSVFNTFSGLYLAKDNDLLLSLPIPIRYILFSRLLTVYLMGLLYSAVVAVPACVVFWILYDASASAVTGGVLFTLLISLIVLTLSCALGWIVAKISVKLKHKSLIAAFASLAFIAVYYFVYFKAKDVLADLIVNAAVYGDTLHSKAYPLYLFGKTGTGDLMSSVTVSIFVCAILALVLFLLSRSFVRIATVSEKAEKRAYNSRSIRKSSCFRALLAREKRRFVSNPTYMLNCGFGTLLLPLCGIAALWKGRVVFSVLNEIFSQNSECIVILLGTAVCILCSMNSITEPSVSLEGNTLWLLRSLPVPTKRILQAKVLLQVLFTSVPCVFCLACLFIVFPVSPLTVFSLFLLSLSFCVLSAQVGLYIGLKMPILNWTSEITPIKQSFSVILDLLFGWVYCGLFGLVFFIADCARLGVIPYILIFCAVNIILCITLHIRLGKRGSMVFESL